MAKPEIPVARTGTTCGTAPRKGSVEGSLHQSRTRRGKRAIHVTPPRRAICGLHGAPTTPGRASCKDSVEDSLYQTPPRNAKRGIEETKQRTICGLRETSKKAMIPLHPVSLVGLDPLDDIDMSDPSSLEPSFFKIRLDMNACDVPVTFANKRARAEWTRIFGQHALEHLIEKR